ncbi:hypothetical protein NDU88_002210 [Pleurodeles waltl]|uniref:Uncharacterized protein n=1 Tax=Pleurodeles waltl TaxID=8319 RepID=A0AAV7LFF6_PLEWA|nr:hypothetical protein NDU88_002210 [Pleurodeles waltl]
MDWHCLATDGPASPHNRWASTTSRPMDRHHLTTKGPAPWLTTKGPTKHLATDLSEQLRSGYTDNVKTTLKCHKNYAITYRSHMSKL